MCPKGGTEPTGRAVAYLCLLHCPPPSRRRRRGSTGGMTAALAHYLLQPRSGLLLAFAGMAALMHFRGRVRLRFARQLSDHSTFTAPYNALVYLFSRVANRPFLNAADFPELAALKRSEEHTSELQPRRELVC